MILRLLLALAWAVASAAAAQEPQDEPDPRLRVEEPETELPARADVPPPGATPLAERPIMVRVGGSAAWDSNMFRSPDPREERIRTVYAGLSVDKSYAQQRFSLDLTEVAHRYDNFPHLDFNALNYLGAWHWRAGPRIGGALSAAREQALADYSEFRNPGQLNVRTTENFTLGLDAWLFGGWHLTGGLSHVQNRYSVPFPQEGSYRASGGEGGVKWVAPSTSWVAFNLRSLDGRYVDRELDPVNRLDDGFRRTEGEALTAWRITAKSSLEGRLAYVDYRSDNFSERDFSGAAARLRYLWQASAKLALNGAFARSIEPWAEAVASHRVDERLALGAAWQAAARITVRLDATRVETDFRDPLPGFAGPERRDVQRAVELQAEWRALRNLSLKAAAQRYRQSSTDPAANYRGTLLSAGLSFAF